MLREQLMPGCSKDTDVFPEACEGTSPNIHSMKLVYPTDIPFICSALALKLIATANYQPGGNVLGTYTPFTQSFMYLTKSTCRRWPRQW
jgi:hypothetical protein